MGLPPSRPVQPAPQPAQPSEHWRFPNLTNPQEANAAGFRNPDRQTITSDSPVPYANGAYSDNAFRFDRNVTPESNNLRNDASAAASRGTFDPSSYISQQGMTDQNVALDQARQQMLGLAPSAAMNAANQGIAASQQQQLSMGHSAMGSGLARAAARQTGMQNASMAPQYGAANLAQLGAADRQAGMAAFGSNANNIRNLDTTEGLGIANGRLDSMGQNLGYSNWLNDQGNRIDTAQLGASAQGVGSQQAYNEGEESIYNADSQRQKDQNADLLRNGMNGASAGLAGFTKVSGSDRKFKTKTRSAIEDIKRALDRLG